MISLTFAEGFLCSTSTYSSRQQCLDPVFQTAALQLRHQPLEARSQITVVTLPPLHITISSGTRIINVHATRPTKWSQISIHVPRLVCSHSGRRTRMGGCKHRYLGRTASSRQVWRGSLLRGSETDDLAHAAEEIEQDILLHTFFHNVPHSRKGVEKGYSSLELWFDHLALKAGVKSRCTSSIQRQ
ncbi:unnamed protein product [Protopolystoma xenopodis]|uniref:Uncharacterized protein n=1 Tax=Protopolystoma xenopodis TaxID=117903 RepID=A0A3S5A1A7_9PLAT|nr:unnamed protein product [Protopolystoma xenopodis]